jgi:hypothetical protein
MHRKEFPSQPLSEAVFRSLHLLVKERFRGARQKISVPQHFPSKQFSTDEPGINYLQNKAVVLFNDFPTKKDSSCAQLRSIGPNSNYRSRHFRIVASSIGEFASV